MNAADIRYLFAYDRWATRRVLGRTTAVDPVVWGATGVVGERGLGTILVHAFGAHQRWWLWLSGSGEEPRPEREPLPHPEQLRASWEAAWTALDGWLDTIDDAWLAGEQDGIPRWRMLAHVVNHGTQHRSEAAALLTDAGQSPGELDMISFAEELAGSTG
jgi:uncharacterized damage-inducible protein DinB